ncbi:unnamed protein product [Penicillium roqueforti FM164]|uniref:Genomic scaffold, ProqFM164S02 n=1 Tax=Penicillium roqueforti (strain FM164) TaxID=1365484 RepID=W6QSW1_PENRF|nr:unnamed protein product [Penicillium roqueforti FM164]
MVHHSYRLSYRPLLASTPHFLRHKKAVYHFKSTIIIRGRDGRNAIIHLFYINILVIILNVLLLLAEYKLHYIQVSFKTVVYSVKLKLEFSILNRLWLLTIIAPDISLQSRATQTDIPRSLQLSSIYRYDKTLGETSSKNMIPPRDIYSSVILSEGHLNTLPGSSSETLPTLELSLSQFSPKFNV